MAEIYVSTDVEADGPIPGDFSMLSFGSAAYDRDGNLVATFSCNLTTLPGAKVDPKTSEWWSHHPGAWKACRADPQDPAVEMPRYVKWLKSLRVNSTHLPPVFVGYPAAYDFMFIYWYLMRFAGESPFSFSALDIKTLAMSVLGCDFRKVKKMSMPARWTRPDPATAHNNKHEHIGISDAKEQGELFFKILRESSDKSRRIAEDL